MMDRLWITIAMFVGIGVFGAGAGFYAGAERALEAEERFREEAKALDERASALESIVLQLASETEFISDTVAKTEEERDAAAQTLSEELERLAQNIEKQEENLSTLSAETDIAGVIKSWSPFVYALECSFEGGGEETTENKGSATLVMTSSGVKLITNKHVIEEDDVTLEECELTRSDNGESYTVPGEAFVEGDEDVATALVPGALLGMATSRICSVDPEIGDTVVVLGYPGIGAKESITATEGIISGFDEVHYTTSAKIERGNSGGAAIHVEKNCFLGLPTLVVAGRIESLARILPIRSF